MQVIIDTLSTQLRDDFNGKTVGGLGADFAPELAATGYIKVIVGEWENITYPSIAFIVVQEAFNGPSFECCVGGLMDLMVDFRVSVDTKKHGQRMAWAIIEELRTWLCGLNGTDDLTAPDYSFVTAVGIPTSNVVDEGTLFHIHLMTPIKYLRQPKS
jgi:hypothetical protein